MIDVISVAKKCFQDEADAILNLIPNLDDNFTKAIELIYESKGKLIVTGVGKSGHIGAKIASTLASTGTPAFFVKALAKPLIAIMDLRPIVLPFCFWLCFLKSV